MEVNRTTIDKIKIDEKELRDLIIDKLSKEKLIPEVKHDLEIIFKTEMSNEKEFGKVEAIIKIEHKYKKL